MERATEKVKNKEFADVDRDAMEGVVSTSNRMSFKDMLMSKQTNKEVDGDEEGSNLGLDDDISLHGDDVEINMDGTYPDICFSERVHDLIDQSMKQTMVVKLLIGYRGLHGRLKSLWDLSGEFQLVDVDNNYLSNLRTKMIITGYYLEDLGWCMGTIY
ncbi:hypothetical protein J1N35_027157 [Gossypium stocksii]|uniref:Uncharacterized protein n=1 Tax=Gossypium stocksii TaxID=47602 RepID=A0A9D3V9S5_9ROSI|nr:hypothetical protein J1N35_027157 [Gossypium stocksii]